MLGVSGWWSPVLAFRLEVFLVADHFARALARSVCRMLEDLRKEVYNL